MIGRGVGVLRPLTLALMAAFGPGLLAVRSEPGAIAIPDSQLERADWRELPGWAADDHAAAFDAFLSSCRAIVARKQPVRDARAIDAPLADICREALVLGPARSSEARAFFERQFRLVRIAKLGETEGFLTGYYEPVVEGSRFPTH